MILSQCRECRSGAPLDLIFYGVTILPRLTAKQEAFCQALAAGSSQSDAYRQAYTVKASTSAATIAASASRLMADPKISTRLDEIRNVMAEAIAWTREDSARALIEIVRGEDPSASAKIAAVKELNAMFGFNAPEKPGIAGQGYTLTVVRALEPIRDEAWL